MYFITHAYFTSYHTVTTLVRTLEDLVVVSLLASHSIAMQIQRKFWASKLLSGSLKMFAAIALVFALSYITALMEAVTIVSVPYYVVEDRFRFYLLGSAFYGIYFYVSFPMYYRMDEKKGERWTLSRAFFDSLAASMLVTIILDLTRISIGHIFAGTSNAGTDGGPPFL